MLLASTHRAARASSAGPTDPTQRLAAVQGPLPSLDRRPPPDDALRPDALAETMHAPARAETAAAARGHSASVPAFEPPPSRLPVPRTRRKKPEGLGLLHSDPVLAQPSRINTGLQSRDRAARPASMQTAPKPDPTFGSATFNFASAIFAFASANFAFASATFAGSGKGAGAEGE